MSRPNAAPAPIPTTATVPNELEVEALPPPPWAGAGPGAVDESAQMAVLHGCELEGMYDGAQYMLSMGDPNDWH